MDEGFEVLDRLEAAKKAIEIWSRIDGRWRMLANEKEADEAPRSPGLERFEEGWSAICLIFQLASTRLRPRYRSCPHPNSVQSGTCIWYSERL